MIVLPGWTLGGARRHVRHLRPRILCRTYSSMLGRATRMKSELSTLDQSLITPEDYIDASMKKTITVDFPFSTKTDNHIRYVTDTESSKVILTPFPRDTRGFLYYHSDPTTGPLGGSVRLRVTPDSSPASFSGGHDLTEPSGSLWQILLLQVVSRSMYTSIGEQLVGEGLVTPNQVSQCQRILSRRKFRLTPHATLFHLESTFLLNFSGGVVLTIVGKELHRMRLTGMLREFNRISSSLYPWTGSAMARFEPSTLPEHAGRRVVHLRIVKILEPVALTVGAHSATTRVLRPKEGELLAVRDRDGEPGPWSYDIDTRQSEVSAAFQVLWDNSRARNGR